LNQLVNYSGFAPSTATYYSDRAKVDNRISLFQAFNFHISGIEKLSGIELAFNTVRKYRSVLKSIKRFLKNSDVYLSDLNYKFAADYYLYLVSIEGLKSNSAYKNIKSLYRVIHIAILNGWLQSNPFKEFKCNYKQPIRPYLTETEILTIRNQKFKSKRLSTIRDLFLFLIHTGLSYSDFYALTSANIEIGVDGNPWIVINRKKTGIRSAIPILPIAKEILNKYEYNLPKVSNQKFNEHLKEIAGLCGISKHISCHIARHTFATTITLSKGVPIETVSKLLGHTNLATTQIYAKVVDQKTAADMAFLM
jgi:site-specific recombinase XerD